MAEASDIVIVGAGQAGLALSHELTAAGREHLVLERGRIGETWRGRWDSFCLVTPNWTVQFPGGAYAGDDPDGFMPRDNIVDHLVAYARSFAAPVREGVTVHALLAADDGKGFRLRTSSGDVLARHVVLASGGYQKAYRPRGAEELPASLHAIDAEAYTNPSALAPGAVLVVGSGQTGCQIADELVRAGRTVFLACGRAPWLPRRPGGRDAIAWILETPFMNHTLADLPSPRARLLSNPQFSGRGGGRDLHYRTLQAQGVELLGHFVGVEEGMARFAPDLAESVAFGDARYLDIRGLIQKACAANGTRPPEMPDPPPFDSDAPTSLDLRRVGTVLFTTGFRPDYTSWVAFPAAFDDLGFPIQQDGSSTVVPGLHFMGVHFQRQRKSATLFGVADDARVLAARLAEPPTKHAESLRIRNLPSK